jgi:precorrin-6A synthase
MMRQILVIGIGAGNPDYVTMQAVDALNRADVFFIPNKGNEKDALRTLRTDICERFIKDRRYRTIEIQMPERAKTFDDYRANVVDWHAAIAAAYETAFAAELRDGETGALLVWGDPSLYDSTLRIIETIRSNGMALDYEVIPGITSVQALAARHRIPLNRIGEPVLLTTGRRLVDGVPDVGNVVVLLDGEQTFARYADQDLDIFWGAYLGTPEEILVSGPLREVADEIEATRQRARQENGWIMDTYLLRKTRTE